MLHTLGAPARTTWSNAPHPRSTCSHGVEHCSTASEHLLARCGAMLHAPGAGARMVRSESHPGPQRSHPGTHVSHPGTGSIRTRCQFSVPPDRSVNDHAVRFGAIVNGLRRERGWTLEGLALSSGMNATARRWSGSRYFWRSAAQPAIGVAPSHVAR